MLEHLADVSIRSLALAPIAAAVLVASGSKRTAALQHALWAAVVCGMLCLFLFGSFLPKLPLPILPARSTPISLAQPVAIGHPPSARQWVIGGTLEPTPILPAAAPRRTLDWSEIAVFAYAAIALALLLRFAIGMLLIRRLIAKSVPIGTFRESASIAVPLTVGWFHPRILLPLEWRDWDRSKLDAVLAHEGTHARRHDGLIAALAGINRCLFWFHPLAWWLERRLRLLAELACDESCVALAGGRERYAALLLEMAQVVDAPHGRLSQHALTMASASHLRQRIDSILQDGRALSRDLSRTAWTTIALCGIPVVLAAATLKFDGEAVLPPLPPPDSVLTAPAPPPPPPPPPRMLSQVQSPGQPRPAGRLQFEVASIRLAVPSVNTGGGRNGGTGEGKAGPNAGCRSRVTIDAGRADFVCHNLTMLLGYVYGLLPDRILGPNWMGDQRFDISAKLAPGATEEQIPEMMRSLLEDRFKLAFHAGEAEVTIYALTVGKGGPKLKPAAPGAEAHSAEAVDPLAATRSMINGITFRQSRTLGSDGRVASLTMITPAMGTVVEAPMFSDTRHWEAPSMSLEGLAELLTVAVGGPVVVRDMTGLKGRYQISLDVSMAEYVALMQTPPHDDGEFETVRLKSGQEAVKKLGLELAPRKGPVETIVIDHLEKPPTEN